MASQLKRTCRPVWRVNCRNSYRTLDAMLSRRSASRQTNGPKSDSGKHILAEAPRAHIGLAVAIRAATQQETAA
jgi:hypothetical protein